MRTILLALLISLTLAACGTKDDSLEQPAPAAHEASTPAQAADGQPSSTNIVNDVVPEGPVGTLQLTDGTAVEITELIKLGNYYLYISGKLNGRTTTVISLTRFRDLQRWGALTFKNKNEITITTKQGKEMLFTDARLYLGSDSPDTYTFYTTNDRYDKAQIEVKKSDVAAIQFR